MKTRIKPQLLFTHLTHFTPSLHSRLAKFTGHLILPPTIARHGIVYICPICASNFIAFSEEENSLIDTEEFTLDHIPPESVGGKLKSVVCKSCNNQAGHKYDHIIKQQLTELLFNKRIPQSSLKAYSIIEGVDERKFNGSISIREDREIEISLQTGGKIKDPKLLEWLKDPGKNFSIKTTFQQADLNLVGKAYLKIAYLACFNHWGYDFVFSQTGLEIRKILTGNAIYPIENTPLIISDDPNLINKIPLDISLIKKPISRQSFLVTFPIYLKEYECEFIASVIIPKNGEWDKLSTLNSDLKEVIPIEYTFEILFKPMLNKIYNDYTME